MLIKPDERYYNKGHTKDAIAIIGLDGRCIYYSPQLSKMLGMRKIPHEKIIQDLIHPDDKSYLKDLISKASKKKSVLSDSEIDFRMIHEDGHPVWLSASTSNYYDEDGNVIGFIASIRDISERKSKEIELERSLEKYRLATEHLEFYKDLFIHDLRNIFSVIRMSSEILNNSYINKDNQVQNTIKLIQNSVKRGLNLISNIQKLSKLEEKTENILEKIEVYQILNDAIKYVQQSFPEKEVRIDVDALSKEYHIKANNLLIDVFENLLNNAVKYNNNPVPRILIKIYRIYIDEKKYIKMEFKDNGMGLTDTQKKIIFLRVPKGNNHNRGMGLGLSLVKKIIESYNGEIWVEDKFKGDYSKGSNFIMMIPEFNNN